MNHPPKAVIFDMDGILVDSELQWPKREKDLWIALGIKYTEEFGKEIVGMKLGDVFALVQEKYNPSLSVQKARKVYDETARIIYQEYSHLMSGVVELIDLLRKQNIPMAIASSSSREWIGMFVEKFKLEGVFQYLLSTESMNLPGKPNSAIYTEAIRLFNVAPQDVVVFEDTVRGLTAGKASGARVVAVPDPRWSHGDFSEADLIAKSLEDPQIISFLGI